MIEHDVRIPAVAKVWGAQLMNVQSGLDKGQTWMPRQYKLAVRAILNSTHQAVPVSGIKRRIGGAALGALVKASLLACRPFSGTVIPAGHTSHLNYFEKFSIISKQNVLVCSLYSLTAVLKSVIA